jgi:hypothetical protein
MGTLTVLAAIVSAPAQNLGLGAGSRQPAPADSAAVAAEPRPDRQDASPRKNQFTKRLGLSARKNPPFDPKVFEARGRELQGQFYEIGTPANPKQFDGQPVASGTASMAKQSNGSRQWLVWVGVAGAAGAAAGAVGYLLMSNAHPASAPPDIPLNLDDGP